MQGYAAGLRRQKFPKTRMTAAQKRRCEDKTRKMFLFGMMLKDFFMAKIGVFSFIWMEIPENVTNGKKNI
jgi:hypothetical protein